MNSGRLSPRTAGCLIGLLVLLMIAQWAPYQWTFSFEPPADESLAAESIEAFQHAEAYQRASEWTALARTLAKIPLLLLIVGSGWAIAVERRWGSTPWRWPARLGFLAAYWLLVHFIGFPAKIMWYQQDRAYQLTHLLPPEYIKIYILGLVIPLLMFLLRKLLVYCHMPILGRHWWWGTVLTMFVLFTLLPEVITRRQPVDLVAQYKPLEDGPLRRELEQLVEGTGRKLNFFTVDSSRRSRRGNVYFGGRVGEEFVIFSDTIIEAVSPRELRYILAHELGHYHTQTRMMLLRTGLSLTVALLMYGLVHRWNGGGAIIPERRLQVLMQLALVGTALSLLVSPLQCALSRWDERVADRFGLKLTQDPVAYRNAVLDVARLNLTSYDVPGWAYIIGSTHPTVRQRLAFIRQWEPGS